MQKEDTLEETVVDPDNHLKNFIIEYVGEKTNPEDELVTLDMVVETLAEDFPDIVLAIAEENWVRGYHQALSDVESGQKLHAEEKSFI